MNSKNTKRLSKLRQKKEKKKKFKETRNSEQIIIAEIEKLLTSLKHGHKVIKSGIVTDKDDFDSIVKAPKQYVQIESILFNNLITTLATTVSRLNVTQQIYQQAIQEITQKDNDMQYLFHLSQNLFHINSETRDASRGNLGDASFLSDY